MKDYIQTEERLKCCLNCLRVASNTTTYLTPYYCMARRMFTSPFNLCVWYVPNADMRGEEDGK